MPPDPLASLARLRRQGVDEARQILVNCLDTEEDSGRRAAMAEASIAQELQIVSLLSASDNAVEGFGVWLRQATAAATAARMQQQRAATDTSRARAALTAARAAAEAIDALRARQATERDAAAAMRAQNDLDEMTRHRPTGSRKTRP